MVHHIYENINHPVLANKNDFCHKNYYKRMGGSTIILLACAHQNIMNSVRRKQECEEQEAIAKKRFETCLRNCQIHEKFEAGGDANCYESCRDLWKRN